MSKQRRTFSTEFKREAALLVQDQGYTLLEASRSVGGGGGRLGSAPLGATTAAGAPWHDARAAEDSGA